VIYFVWDNSIMGNNSWILRFKKSSRILSGIRFRI